MAMLKFGGRMDCSITKARCVEAFAFHSLAVIALGILGKIVSGEFLIARFSI
jgi:hypothetical protein